MIYRELKDFQRLTTGDRCREYRSPGMNMSQLSPEHVNCVMIRE